MFFDSWYVSGALGNVWKGDSIFTKPTLSESDVEYPVAGSEADDEDGEEDREEDGEGGEPSPTRSEGWGQRERRRLRESTHCQSAEWEKRRDASEGVSGWMGRCIGRSRGT